MAKRNIDQLNPKTPGGWMRTRLGSYIVEWSEVKNGKLTGKTVRVSCTPDLRKCTVSEPLKVLSSPIRAISFAQSYMKKSRR